jgi:hypothetical protein
MAHREEERGDELRQKDRPGRLSEPHGPVSDRPYQLLTNADIRAANSNLKSIYSRPAFRILGNAFPPLHRAAECY